MLNLQWHLAREHSNFELCRARHRRFLRNSANGLSLTFIATPFSLPFVSNWLFMFQKSTDTYTTVGARCACKRPEWGTNYTREICPPSDFELIQFFHSTVSPTQPS